MTDRCENCEDGYPLETDPVTGLRYHRVKDPIGGRTFNEVCTHRAEERRPCSTMTSAR